MTCCWAFLNKRFNSSFIWSKKKTNQKELLSNCVYNFGLSDSADGSDDQPATADGVYEDSDDDISYTPSIPVRSSDCLFLLLFILLGLVSVLFSLSHIWLRIVKSFNAANLIKSYSFDQCSPQMTAFPKFLTTQQQSKFDRAGIIQFNLIQQKKNLSWFWSLTSTELPRLYSNSTAWFDKSHRHLKKKFKTHDQLNCKWSQVSSALFNDQQLYRYDQNRNCLLWKILSLIHCFVLFQSNNEQ